MEIDVDLCKTCKFFLAESNMGGLCRRNPPVPVFNGEFIVVVFPAMTPAGWCGEFAPNPEAN